MTSRDGRRDHEHIAAREMHGRERLAERTRRDLGAATQHAHVAGAIADRDESPRDASAVTGDDARFATSRLRARPRAHAGALARR